MKVQEKPFPYEMLCTTFHFETGGKDMPFNSGYTTPPPPPPPPVIDLHLRAKRMHQVTCISPSAGLQYYIDLGRPKSGAPIYYFFSQFNYSVNK